MPHEAREARTTAGAAVTPLDEGEEIHPRRRLLSTGAGGRPNPRSSGAGASTGGTSLLDRLNYYVGNTKLVLALLISVVLLTYFSEEYVALSVSTNC